MTTEVVSRVRRRVLVVTDGTPYHATTSDVVDLPGAPVVPDGLANLVDPPRDRRLTGS